MEDRGTSGVSQVNATQVQILNHKRLGRVGQSKRPKDAEDFLRSKQSRRLKLASARIFYENGEKTMKSLKNILISMLLCVGIAAHADASTHYFDPEAPGHGVSVTKDSGQGSSFIWYLYSRDGNATWLISTENCTEYPCVTALAQANGVWMGGEVELVEVGDVFIDFVEGKLIWDYNVADWALAGDCGRMVWLYQTKCVGTFEMEAID